MNNDEIWKIVEHNNAVYFHSFGSIYAYDGVKVFRVPKEGSFMFPQKVHGEIYIQKVQDSLYTLSDLEFTPVRGSSFLADEEVKSIISIDDETLLIGSSAGLYTYRNQRFSPWEAENTQEIVRNNINTMIRTTDKIIVGTTLAPNKFGVIF